MGRSDVSPAGQARTLFGVIRDVTSRVEPFHSVALAWFLDEDRSLARAFLAAAVPAAFLEATGLMDAVDELVVTPEDKLGAGDRVDLTLVGPRGVVAVEVKTTDASATAGQLARYRDQLIERDATRGLVRPVHLVYLTPFTKASAGEVAARLATVREFDRFAQAHPGGATHLGWADVVALYPEDREGLVGAAMRDHRAHVESVICGPHRLERLARSRGLEAFLGEVAVQGFFDAVEEAGVVFDDLPGADLVIPLDQGPGARAVLCDALLALVDSAALPVRRPRTHQIGRPELLQTYCEGPFGDFHTRLFDGLAARPWAWLRGTNRLGLRVVHAEHGSGVSVCTLTGDSLRWVRVR